MKYLKAFIVLVLTVAAYIGLMLGHPILVAVAGIGAAGPIADAEALRNSLPLWVWLIPGAFGGIALGLVLDNKI